LWGGVEDVAQMPDIVTFRLRHYFGTYKMVPGQPNRVKILGLHGTEQALTVVTAAMADYAETYSRQERETTIASGNPLQGEYA
jgi:inorganic pyrophosphatase